MPTTALRLGRLAFCALAVLVMTAGNSCKRHGCVAAFCHGVRRASDADCNGEIKWRNVACGNQVETGPRLNAILVTVDTLRPDHLGCYGYVRPTSPNVDRLARSGVLFRNAVSVSSWTLPSHASILTGLYPAEHGVVADINALPAAAYTLAEALADHGYATFAAVSHVYLGSRWGFDQGFQHFDERAAVGSPQRPVAGHIVKTAISWLEGRSKTAKPFFLWLHIFDPHWDYAPPPPFDTRFDPDYAGSMKGDYASLKPYIKAVRGYRDPPYLAPQDFAHVVALYDGEIAYVDSKLGELLAALERLGLADRTVVVVTGDHGEEFMEHGSLEGHQWTLYDEVVLVPMIVRDPELPVSRQGRIIEQQISNVGLSGTLLDILHIDNSWRSFYRLLDAHTEPKRERKMGESSRGYTGERALLDLTVRRTSRQVGIRTREYKLLRFADGRQRLFARPRVGNETRDVSAQRTNETRRLSAELDSLLGELSPIAGAGGKRKPLTSIETERLRSTGYLN